MKLLIVLVIILFITSCNTNTMNVKQNDKTKQTLKENNKYYTFDEYITKYKDDLQDENFILSMENINLLNQKFYKATKSEIEGDIAYNEKALKIAMKYRDALSFLNKVENIEKLAKHLNYNKSNLNFVIFKNKLAIIAFLHQTPENFAYKAFLVFIDDNVIKIKLIAYIIT